MSEGVTNFIISDLIGGIEPSPVDDISTYDRKTRRGKRERNSIPIQTSSFKMSNKLAVQGNKPKKIKKNQNRNIDVLFEHETKLKYFSSLQDSLPEKRKRLAELPNGRNRDALENDIVSIENREEEINYLLLTQRVLQRYCDMLERTKNDSGEGLVQDTTGQITKFITKYDNVEKDQL